MRILLTAILDRSVVVLLLFGLPLMYPLLANDARHGTSGTSRRLHAWPIYATYAIPSWNASSEWLVFWSPPDISFLKCLLRIAMYSPGMGQMPRTFCLLNASSCRSSPSFSCSPPSVHASSRPVSPAQRRRSQTIHASYTNSSPRPPILSPESATYDLI